MATDCLPGLRNSAYLVIVVIVPLPSVAFEQTSSWNSSLHYPTQDRKIHLAKNAMFFCIFEGGRSRDFCFSTDILTNRFCSQNAYSPSNVKKRIG